MTGLEVILLIIGICIFVVGFILPARKEKTSEQIQNISREEIRQMLEGAVSDAKIQIEEDTQETISYDLEKTERTMERLTNEKIAAITEYADTVLKDINKNHKEVMFLYDMLNDKHDTFLETVNQAEKVSTMVKESTLEQMRELTGSEDSKAAHTAQADSSNTQKHAESDRVRTTTAKAAPKEKTVKKNIKTPKTNSTSKEQSKQRARELLAEPEQFNIQFANNDDDERNSNQQILELYKQGKSNMVIAKELGLGVGEVKLVIDLYKGMSS